MKCFLSSKKQKTNYKPFEGCPGAKNVIEKCRFDHRFSSPFILKNEKKNDNIEQNEISRFIYQTTTFIWNKRKGNH